MGALPGQDAVPEFLAGASVVVCGTVREQVGDRVHIAFDDGRGLVIVKWLSQRIVAQACAAPAAMALFLEKAQAAERSLPTKSP